MICFLLQRMYHIVYCIKTHKIAIVNFTLSTWKLWITFRMNEISNESLDSQRNFYVIS